MMIQQKPHLMMRGFSLVELAIVLIIVSLLTGGLMLAVSAQHESIAISETNRRLNDAKDALLGYAAANGRLPCPARGNATGAESPVGGGACDAPWDGFLPAITLGLLPIDGNGYALDGWGNPIRYAITTYVNVTYCPNYLFVSSNCLKMAWNGGSSPLPDLRICSTSTGMIGTSATAVCASGTELANNAVAVIFSRGKNGGLTPASADETANGDTDRLFVSHPPTPPGANEFDDIVIWLSPNILYNRMITAGRLP